MPWFSVDRFSGPELSGLVIWAVFASLYVGGVLIPCNMYRPM